MALDQKPDITTFAAVRGAAKKAYEMAGLGPEDIQFAELHDCFTIAEIVAMEDLGFVERGRGGFFTAEGGTRRDGPMPINASGGLKSKGHPVGATGVAQICDLVQQIRCEAGDRQLKRHSRGLGAEPRRQRRHLRRDDPGENTEYASAASSIPRPSFISRPSVSRRTCLTRSIIVKLDDGSSVTARVDGERVAIDDRVVETGTRDGISFFRKQTYETC